MASTQFRINFDIVKFVEPWDVIIDLFIDSGADIDAVDNYGHGVINSIISKEYLIKKFIHKGLNVHLVIEELFADIDPSLDYINFNVKLFLIGFLSKFDNEVKLRCNEICSKLSFKPSYLEAYRNDFLMFLEGGDLADSSTFNGMLKFHSLIIYARLGNINLDLLSDVLEFFSLEEAKIFLKWLYTGCATYPHIIGMIIRHIYDLLNSGLSIYDITNVDTFLIDMKRLYDSRDETGDFSIKIPKRKVFIEQGGIITLEERVIRVHKHILAARSGFFRNMFLTSDEDDQLLMDPSKIEIDFNIEAFETFIKYIYTGVGMNDMSMDFSLFNEDDRMLWQDMLDYFQVK